MIDYLIYIGISWKSDNVIRNYIECVLMILINYLFIFTKILNFDFIKESSFLYMEKDLINMELQSEKTFWELLTEENIDQDELIYGEGVIRQEDY